LRRRRLEEIKLNLEAEGKRCGSVVDDGGEKSIGGFVFVGTAVLYVLNLGTTKRISWTRQWSATMNSCKGGRMRNGGDAGGWRREL